MPTKPLRIDVDEAVALYQAGHSIEKIAGQAGVSGMTLRRRIVAAGAEIRVAADSTKMSSWHRYGDLTPWIERYVSGETMQRISQESGISRRRLEMAVVKAGHQLRTIAQAVGLRYTRMSVSERRTLVAHAHIAKKGRKASPVTLERRAKTCEATLQLASRADLILCLWLAQRGVKLTPQKAVGPYNLDIAIEGSLVAVEVNGDWHYFPDRAPAGDARREYLLHRGWAIIEVCLTRTEKSARKYLRPACADKIVSLLQAAGTDKAAIGQHCMIGGDGEPLA